MRKTTLVRSLFTFLLFALVSFGVKGQDSQVLYYEDFGNIDLNWEIPSIKDYNDFTGNVRPEGGAIWGIHSFGDSYNNFLYTDPYIDDNRNDVIFNFDSQFKPYSNVSLHFSFYNGNGAFELYFQSGNDWNKIYSSSHPLQEWTQVSLSIDESYLSNFKMKFVRVNDSELAIDDIKIEGVLVPITTCDLPVASSGIFSGDDIMEVPMGSSVTIKCSTLNSRIHYRLNNGMAIRKDTNEIKVSIATDGSLRYWASVIAEDGSEIKSATTLKQIKTLNTLERVIFSGENAEDRAFVMFPSFVGTNNLEAKNIELASDGDLIISNLGQMWDVYASAKNSENYYIGSSDGRFLSVTGNSFQLNQSGTPWQYDSQNKIYYCVPEGTTVNKTFVCLKNSNNQRFFSLGDMGTSESVKLHTPSDCLFKLTGTHTRESINEILAIKNLKWIDVLGVLWTGSTTLIAPANPNCIIFTKMNYAAWSHRVLSNKCLKFNLTDKQPFGTPSDFTATAATYTRQAWQDGGWETIIIPFDVTSLPDGYIFDEFVGISQDKKEIRFRQVTSLTANKPYLMKKIKDLDAIQKECVFTASGITVSSKMNNSEFVGVYEKTMTPGKFILGVSEEGEAIFGKGTANSYVMPFRAYLDITLPTGAAPMRVVHMVDDTTALDDTKEADWYAWGGDPGEIVIRTPVEKNINVVSVEGRLIRTIKIKAGEEIIRGLSKGLYIVNGKKIVVK